MKQTWDVVIIGAGLSGYVAAHFLAKAKLSVLMLEKSTSTGGRAKTNKVNGQYFNLGPHAVYKKGDGRTILEQLGVKVRGGSPSLNVELCEHEHTTTAPFTPAGMLKTSYLGWKERLEWISVLLTVMRLAVDQIKEQTYQQWLEQHVTSYKIRNLLYALGRLATYSDAPSLISAKVMLTHLKASLGGVIYVDGGWQSMIDQLHNQAVVHGVEVRTGSTVQNITTSESNGFKLQLSDNQEVYGKHVISTTGPRELIPMLNLDQDQQGFLSAIKTVKGASLDVALTRLPDPNRLFALGLTSPLYYSVHTPYAKLSDQGESVILHVYKYYQPEEMINGEQVRQELEQFLEQFQPGWKNVKITSRFIPQLTVNQRLPQLGDEQQLLQLQEAIPGFYVAGDWACPHSMLLEGAVSSAKRAAEHIIHSMR